MVFAPLYGARFKILDQLIGLLLGFPSCHWYTVVWGFALWTVITILAPSVTVFPTGWVVICNATPACL